MSRLKKFIVPVPKNVKPERRLIQARISRDLYEEIRAKLKEDGVTIIQLIEAAARMYLKET